MLLSKGKKGTDNAPTRATSDKTVAQQVDPMAAILEGAEESNCNPDNTVRFMKWFRCWIKVAVRRLKMMQPLFICLQPSSEKAVEPPRVESSE